MPVDALQRLFVRQDALPHQKGVVPVGLDFHIVIKVCQRQQLFLRLPVEHRPIQLPRFAGGAHQQPSAEHRKHAPGYLGLSAQMIQMGIGDDLIQVLHPRLGSGQQDDVVGFALGLRV